MTDQSKDLEMRAQELLRTVSDPDQVNMMPAVRRLVVNGLNSIIDGIAALEVGQAPPDSGFRNHHCQNGRADVCLASQRDGVVCSDDTCDIDDGIRADHTKPQPPSAVVGRDSVGTDAAVWGLISAAVECGAVPDEDDNGIWWTLNLPAFYKLEAKIHAAKSPQQAAGVPVKMHIPADAWEAAAFAFGGPATGDGEAYMDCTAWIGDCLDDEGNAVHGLHLSCDECPEEGSITLATFTAATKPEVGS